MNDNGKTGAWIGVSIVTAVTIFMTGNPWYVLFLLFVLLTY